MKSSQEASIAWAKSEFQDATSYLNSTLEVTTDGYGVVSDHALKLDIRSFGIFSVKEERIEYIGSNTDASFVLFDASGPTDEKSLVSGCLPPVQKSGLDSKKAVNATVNSVGTDPRRHRFKSGEKNRSKSPHRGTSSNHIFNSTQTPVVNHTFSQQSSSNANEVSGLSRQVYQPPLAE